MGAIEHNRGGIEVQIYNTSIAQAYEEHITTERRKSNKENPCIRYIRVNDNDCFEIQVKIHKEFDFSGTDCLEICAVIPGLDLVVARQLVQRPDDAQLLQGRATQDIVLPPTYVLPIPLAGSKTLLGAKLKFMGLTVDNDAPGLDVMARVPAHLRSIDVEIRRLGKKKPSAPKETPEEIRNSFIDKAEQLMFTPTVSALNYQQQGIRHMVSFHGGNVQASTADNSSSEALKYLRPKSAPEFKFQYHYRTEEFLIKNDIVKYPAPLYVWQWHELKEKLQERVDALDFLQQFHKEKVIEAIKKHNTPGITYFNGTPVFGNGSRFDVNQPKFWILKSSTIAQAIEINYIELQKFWKRCQQDPNFLPEDIITHQYEIISLKTGLGVGQHLPFPQPPPFVNAKAILKAKSARRGNMGASGNDDDGSDNDSNDDLGDDSPPPQKSSKAKRPVPKMDPDADYIPETKGKRARK